MAELEVAKHGKNVIQLMTKKEHKVSHRIREIVIEILTIVFAVSMSIWLHGLSEHHHKQQEVKSFLLGLKADMLEDARSLDEGKDSFRRFDANYAYLASLDPAVAPDLEKFKDANVTLNSNWIFIPTRSRYDGFLMSGKLTNIEDEKLLSSILNLYQALLPQLQTSEGGWLGRQHKLRDYLDDKLEANDELSRFHVLSTPRGKRLLQQMNTSPQLYQRYQAYIDECRSIARQIDALYPEQAAAKTR